MGKGILFLLFFARLSFRHLICARVAEEGWGFSIAFTFLFLLRFSWACWRGKRWP